MGKRIRSTISTIIVVMALLFTALVAFTIFTTKPGEAPELFGYSMLRVVSGSMEPEIPTGSLIWVKSCEPSEVAEGDVISFYSRDVSIAGQINTHRVIAIEFDGAGYQFETKGDANLNADSFAVYGSDIIGKVVHVSIILGKLAALVGSRAGLLVIVVIPLAIIFVINLKDVKKAYKESLAEEKANIEAEIEAQIRKEMAEKNRPEANESKNESVDKEV